MHLTWHAEQNGIGEPLLIAREMARGRMPIAVVGPRSKMLGYTWGWIGSVIMPDHPSSGPFHDLSAAVTAVQRLVRRHLDRDATFVPVPRTMIEAATKAACAS